jgi:hypothetical protein
MQSVLLSNFAGKCIFYLRDGVGGEIAEVRNGIVDSVLTYSRENTPISHLFWVDDDVLVMPGAMLELLHQSKKFNVPIVNGVYFQKLADDLTSPLIYPEPGGGADVFRPDMIYEVFAAHMGLTLVRREVYDRMAAELDLGKDKYGRPRWYRTSDSFEDTSQDERGVIDIGYTEDTFFYRNAASLGLKVLADTTRHAFGFHIATVRACLKCEIQPEAANARSCPKCGGSLSLIDKGYPTRQWNQWINGEKICWWNGNGEVTVWD